MYVILVSNNRIARYISTDDVVDGKGGFLGTYLEKESLDIPEDGAKCVSFKKRTTKAGNQMANAIFTDAAKNLTACMVFSNMVDKAFVKCASGAIVRPQLAETKDGALFLQSI